MPRKPLNTPSTARQASSISGLPENRLGELKKFGAVMRGDEWERETVYLATIEMLRDEAAFIMPVELGEMFGVTRTRIIEMANSGVFKQNAEGRYPRRENLAIAMQTLRERVAGGKDDIATLKKQKLSVEIEILTAQARAVDSKYLPRDAVERAWADMAMLAKGKFLATAGKVAPRVVLASNEAEAEKIIADEIREALGELARTPDYDAGNESEAQPETQNIKADEEKNESGNGEVSTD